MSIRLVLLAVMLILGAGYQLVAHTAHHLTGTQTTATLVDRVSSCRVEYQVVGEAKRNEAMDCGEAKSFQKTIGSNKIKLHETHKAVLRFAAAGRQQQVEVSNVKLVPHSLKVGDRLPIVYATSDPKSVREPLTLDGVRGYVMGVVLGLVFLAFGTIGPLVRLGKRVLNRGQRQPEAPVSAEAAFFAAINAPRSVGSATAEDTPRTANLAPRTATRRTPDQVLRKPRAVPTRAETASPPASSRAS